MCPLQAPASSESRYFILLSKHPVRNARMYHCPHFYLETVEVQRGEATGPTPRSKGGDRPHSPGVRPPRKGLWTRPERPRGPADPLPVCPPPHPSPGMSVARWWCGLSRVTEPLSSISLFVEEPTVPAS